MHPFLNDPHYMGNGEGEREDSQKERSVKHEVIDMSRVTVDLSDTRPHWEQVEPSENIEVIRAYSVTRSNEPAEAPHYVDPNYGNKRKVMAERIAEAVKDAILSGDLDPVDILPSN